MFEHFIVSTSQILAVIQVWFIPLLICAFQFNGVYAYWIAVGTIVCFPLLFNLVAMSHYWHRKLLVTSVFTNGLGGAGAMAVVVITWADPNYTNGVTAPSMREGNVIMLMVGISMSLLAVLQIALLIKNFPDSSYSCCWGNPQGERYLPVDGQQPQAPKTFIHLIRTMRAMAILSMLVSIGFIWGNHFQIFVRRGTYFEQEMSIISLFYWVMNILWCIIAFVLSFNVNSSRKLRFAAVNGIVVTFVSVIAMLTNFAVLPKGTPVSALGPGPWLMMINAFFLSIWDVCALSLGLTAYPFRPNGCCWPDCTPKRQLFDEFLDMEPLEDGL